MDSPATRRLAYDREFGSAVSNYRCASMCHDAHVRTSPGRVTTAESAAAAAEAAATLARSEETLHDRILAIGAEAVLYRGEVYIPEPGRRVRTLKATEIRSPVAGDYITQLRTMLKGGPDGDDFAERSRNRADAVRRARGRRDESDRVPDKPLIPLWQPPVGSPKFNPNPNERCNRE